MAWTAPRTWTDGEIPTAAVFNTHVRDNLAELSPTALGAKYGTRTLLNIKDYGAVCDGTTNDTLAVRAAVAAVTTLRASGFARPNGILIPHGTTRLEVNGAGAQAPVTSGWRTGAVVIPADFVVAGEGPTSIVKYTGVPATAYGSPNQNSAFIVVAGAKNVEFHDFTVIGENGTDATGFTAVANNDSAAIDFSGPTATSDCLVQNVTFKNLYGFSVHDAGENVRIHVKDCTTLYCANGINANASYSHFTGNTILNSEGLECAGGRSLIAHNTIQNALGGAISSGGNFTTNNVVPGSVVAFNVIDGSAGSGIVVADSAHFMTIIGNTVRRTARQGIVCASSPGSHLVGENIVANNTVVSAGLSTGSATERVGIYIGGTSPTLIIGNNVSTTDDAGYDTYYGCLVDGYALPAGSTISGNRFRGSNTDLIAEGPNATGLRIGDNDIVTLSLGSGASAAEPVTRFNTLHKGVQTFGHHLVSTTDAGGNFTAAPNAAATAASRSSGTDVAGQVNYTTAGGTTGDLFTVTFGRTYATAPKVFLQATDTKMVNAGIYLSLSTTTGFTVSCTNAHAAGTMGCWFMVMGNS